MHTVLLSALAAGLVAVGVTVAIERWGGIVGGLLGTLPSTIIPASVGIWLASPARDDFVLAVCATPVGMLVNVGFLYLWRAVPTRLPAGSVRTRLAAMLVVSLTGWALAAAAGVGLLSLGRPLWIGAGTTALTAAWGLVATRHHRPAPRGTRAVGRGTLVARGLLAAMAIGGAVLLSHLGSPLLAGMASVFPAIFLTTMVSLWLSQGEAVQGGAVGPMMLGSAAVSIFAMACTWTYPHLGLALGVPTAWALAVGLVTVPSYLRLR